MSGSHLIDSLLKEAMGMSKVTGSSDFRHVQRADGCRGTRNAGDNACPHGVLKHQSDHVTGSFFVLFLVMGRTFAEPKIRQSGVFAELLRKFNENSAKTQGCQTG